MSKEFEQRAIESALSTRVETQPVGVQWSLDNATDWTGTCGKCGVALKGTLVQVAGHKCEVGDSHE